MTTTFATEAEMCAAFLRGVPKEWTAYAETAGWDILLVRGGDGFQVGVQAKLRLNTAVINQAIENGYSWERNGPDCRAVLVPRGRGEFSKICAYVGITVVVMNSYPAGVYGPPFFPSLPVEGQGRNNDEWHELLPTERHRLPEYIPDVVAGSPSPLQLTEWKIKAIKIAVMMERNGFVTRADFSALRLDPRRWLPSANQWLAIQSRTYVRGPHWPDFRRQHPVAYAQIEADADKWMPARPSLLKAG